MDDTANTTNPTPVEPDPVGVPLTVADAEQLVRQLAAAVGESAATMALSVEPLGRDVADLRDEMRAYREAFETVDRRTWRIVAAGVLAALVLVIAVTVALVVSHSNADVITAIRACTEPGHDCYDANQARTDQRLIPFVRLICDATPPERRHPPCTPS